MPCTLMTRDLWKCDENDCVGFGVFPDDDYDLNGCAYILVKGGSIVNKKAIKNEISSGIIIYPSVTFNKNNPPSEIYLVDPNPRADTKQWLIYKS